MIRTLSPRLCLVCRFISHDLNSNLLQFKSAETNGVNKFVDLYIIISGFVLLVRNELLIDFKHSCCIVLKGTAEAICRRIGIFGPDEDPTGMILNSDSFVILHTII